MIEELFREVDQDADGVITYSEFRRFVDFAMKNNTDPFKNDLDNVLQSHIFKNYRRQPVTLATNEIYAQFDQEADMVISLPEFKAGLMNIGTV